MSENGITVSGGAGGITAQLAELEDLAATLEAAATALDSACVARNRLASTVAEAGHAVASLGGARGLAACEDRARVLAGGVRQVAVMYAEAEDESAARMRGVAIYAGHALGEAGPLAALWAVELGALGVAEVAWLRFLRGTPTPSGASIRWLGSPGIAGRGRPARSAFGRLFSGLGRAARRSVAVDRPTAEALIAGFASYLPRSGRVVSRCSPTRWCLGAAASSRRCEQVDRSTRSCWWSPDRRAAPRHPAADEADALSLVGRPVPRRRRRCARGRGPGRDRSGSTTPTGRAAGWWRSPGRRPATVGGATRSTGTPTCS